MKRALVLSAILAISTPFIANGEERMRPIRDKVTQEECSACHMAYPAGFLPGASWHRIMTTLGDHFGEDATLDEQTRAKIEQYLVSNASDTRRKVKPILVGDPPLRITELRWFVSQHRHEVSQRAIKKAGSMSNCQACHRGAERGYFEDD